MNHKFVAFSRHGDVAVMANDLKQLADEMESSDLEADDCIFFYGKVIEVQCEKVLKTTTVLEIKE